MSPSHRSSEEEPCVARIQQILLEDYVVYLRSIGLQLLQIEYVNYSNFIVLDIL